MGGRTHPASHVVVRTGWVVDDWFVVALDVETEVGWRHVEVVENAREQRRRVT